MRRPRPRPHTLRGVLSRLLSPARSAEDSRPARIPPSSHAGSTTRLPHRRFHPRGETLERRDLLAVVVWDGRFDSGAATPDDSWNTAANWVGDEAPLPGDYLHFPATAARLASTNNFAPQTAFAGLIFSGSGYSVGGAGIALERGVINEGLGNELHLPLRLANDQAFVSRGSLTIAGSIDLQGRVATLDGSAADDVPLADRTNSLVVSGMITGAGDVRATGTGVVRLAAANTFTGAVEVAGGRLVVSNSNLYQGLTTIRNGAVLEVASATALGVSGASTAAGVEVFDSGTLELSGGVSVNGESIESTGTLTLRAVGGANVWTGAIAVAGALTVESAAIGGTVRLTGAVSAAAFETSSSTADRHELAGATSITGNARMAALDVSNDAIVAGELFLTGSLVRSGATISASTINVTSSIVDGTLAAITAMQGGNVSGNGTLEYQSGEFTILDPGDNLSGGSLGLGRVASSTILTTFAPLILGPTVEVDFDRLDVRGNLELREAVLQPVFNAYVPPVGQSFVIIQNDGSDPIEGQFQALPADSLLLVNDLVFEISYDGGDGNDVALVRVDVAVWDGRPDSGGLSADAQWTTASNWLGDTAPGANAILLFPADSGAPRATSNDFVSPVAFRAVILTGGDYELAGSEVVLSNGLINTGANNSVMFGIELAGAQAFRSDGSLTLAGPLDLNGATWTIDTRSTLGIGLDVAGTVSGGGQIVKDGMGTASLTAEVNSFTAPLLVRDGLLVIESSNSFAGQTVLAGGGVQLSHNLALGFADGSLAAGIQVQRYGRIVLSPGVNIVDETVVGAGTLSIETASGSATWSSPITIDGTLNVNNLSTNGQLTFTQPIVAGMHQSDGRAEAPNVYRSSINVSGFCLHTGSVFSGATSCVGALFLQDSMVESAGELTTNGSATLQSVRVDGRLTASVDVLGSDVSGYGQIEMPKGSLHDVYPGTATDVGTLAVGTTTLGDYHPQIGGVAGPGVADGHDLLAVEGLVTIKGDLDLSVRSGAVLSFGDRFLLISNDGADVVKGQFRGLPQGGLVTVDGFVFQIDYSAGDGNDVALTRLAAAVWDGSADGSGVASIDDKWTTAANWVGDLAPLPDDILLFPEDSVFRKTSSNDFAVGTTFNAIRIDGNDYALNGNSVRLTGGIGNRGAGTSIGMPIVLANTQGFSNSSLATMNFVESVHLGGFALTLDCENSATNALQLSGPVSGSGGIVKQGSGVARLAATANSFTGYVSAEAGELILDGQNVYAGKTTISGNATVTLGNPSALGAADGTDGTGVEIVDSGRLEFSTGILVADERLSGSGTITMTARNGTSRWTGDIDVGTGFVIDNALWSGNLVLDGQVTAPVLSATWNGSSRNTIQGDVAVGDVAFATGLDGTGTISFPSGQLDLIRPGTTLQTGVLATSGGRLRRHATRIEGLTVGVDYDQLAVTGPLDLSLARLSVTVDSGFEPAREDEFMIVSKTGLEAASGYYQSLPQGSILLVNGHVFTIDYRGGDGNDIVLRTLSGDLPPTLTLNAATNIEVNEGSNAIRGGQYAAARPGQSVVISSSIGSVTQTGSDGGSWNWSISAVDGPSSPIDVTIRATDPLGVYSEVAFNYRVLNVPPVFTSLTNSAASISCTKLLEPTSLAGSFTDAGIADTHTAIVDWGDGSQSAATITQAAGGGGTLNATHRYLIAGKFTIKVTLLDDDGGFVESTTTAYITGGSLVNGVLTVIGTCGGDLVTIARFPDGRTQLNARFCATGCTTGWSQSSIYPPNSITAIRMELGNAKDTATISELIKSPAYIDAGDGDDIITGGGGNDTILGGEGLDALNGGGGNDSLSGGNGNDSITGGNGNDTVAGGAGDDRLLGAAGQDILFGEAGNDTLFGGTTCLDDPNSDILVGGDGRDTLCGGDGRDILIGGLGADNLQGNAGDDVVLGGVLLDDTDLTQMATLLIAARNAWASALDYAVRVTQTRNILQPGSLSWDDRSSDAMRGEAGRDWLLGDRDSLLADNDTLFDRATNETFDQVVDNP